MGGKVRSCGDVGLGVDVQCLIKLVLCLREADFVLSGFFEIQNFCCKCEGGDDGNEDNHEDDKGECSRDGEKKSILPH